MISGIRQTCYTRHSPPSNLCILYKIDSLLSIPNYERMRVRPHHAEPWGRRGDERRRYETPEEDDSVSPRWPENTPETIPAHGVCVSEKRKEKIQNCHMLRACISMLDKNMENIRLKNRQYAQKENGELFHTEK